MQVVSRGVRQYCTCQMEALWFHVAGTVGQQQGREEIQARDNALSRVPLSFRTPAIQALLFESRMMIQLSEIVKKEGILQFKPSWDRLQFCHMSRIQNDHPTERQPWNADKEPSVPHEARVLLIMATWNYLCNGFSSLHYQHPIDWYSRGFSFTTQGFYLIVKQ